MKVVFLGSSAYVIPPCEALLHHDKHDLCAVVCPPARPAGRSRRMQDPALAQWTKALDVSALLVQQSLPACLQPSSPHDEAFVRQLQSLQPDVMITASYGFILRESFFALARYGVINIHPSRLPQYRGPTPVQTALLEGQSTTAITILQTVKRVDSGPIIVQKAYPIPAHHTTHSLLQELFQASTEAVLEALTLIADPCFSPSEQDESQASYTQKITKDMGRVDFSSSPKRILQRYRAFVPWPKSYGFFRGKRVIFEHMQVVKTERCLGPGEFYYDQVQEVLVVGAGEERTGPEAMEVEAVGITVLTFAGKKAQKAAIFWNMLQSQRAEAEAEVEESYRFGAVS